MRRPETKTHVAQGVESTVGSVPRDNIYVAQLESKESLMFKKILLKPKNQQVVKKTRSKEVCLKDQVQNRR